MRTDRLVEQVLVTQDSGRLRGFHNLDAVVAYLQAIGVSWFNVDTTGLPVVTRCPELLSPTHVHMDMDIKIWTPERLLTIVYTPDQQAAIDEAIAIALSSVDRWGIGMRGLIRCENMAVKVRKLYSVIKPVW